MSTDLDVCSTCKATGLAMQLSIILPVPQTCGNPVMPTWAVVAPIAAVALTGYQYALRSMRSGFVYVFFSKNSHGSNEWQSWNVNDGGQLYPVGNPLGWAVPNVHMQCGNRDHNPARLHHIVIKDPHLCKTAWIAFSDKQWSAETLKRYADDATLRGRRMLAFEPAQLIASDGAHGTNIVPASVGALESICDYAPSFDASKLPFASEDANAASISVDDKGGFNVDQLAFQSTSYPWADGRRGTAIKTCELLKMRSRKQDGTPHPGVVVALPDAIGCTLEMNGYRNEVTGRIAQYSRERDLQITAITDLNGLQVALRQKTQDAVDQVWDWDAALSATRLAGARSAGLSGDRMAMEEDLCRRWENDARTRASRVLAEQRSLNIGRGRAAYDQDQRRVDASLDKRRQSLASTGEDARRQQSVEDEVASTWSDYIDRIDTDARDLFQKKWDAFLVAADKLIDQRTGDLVKWLEAPALLTALEDYAPANGDDGVMFEDLIGGAIVGMSSSTTARAKIDAWVNEMKATQANLLWRAIAQNNSDAVVDVNAILKEAYAAPTALTVKAWEIASKELKWNKVADIAKKSLTFFNNNTKAVNDTKSGIAAVSGTRGLDLILSTTGYRLLKPFAKVGDTVNELVMQTFLSVRSGALPSAALALAESQAKYQAAERDAFIQRFRSYDAYLSDAAKARQAELGARWKALSAAADVVDAQKGTFNAAREARIALIVVLFESLNLYKTAGKLSADPRDAKLKSQLVAAGLSTGSSMVGVMTEMIKGVADAKDKAISYQALKLGGAGLSALASIIGGWNDAQAARKDFSSGDYRAAILLVERAAFQGILGPGLTLLTGLSYCSPSIAAFGERYGAQMVGKAATLIAKKILLGRAALMLAGLEVTLFVQFVSMVIWRFEPSALDDWCDLNAFGKKRKDKAKDAYQSAEQQQKALTEAIEDVM